MEEIMSEIFLMQLSLILILGIGAQWISWRLKIPSIVLLLSLGFLAGPILHLLQPDLLFGNFLLPAVSISVAIILFEGGLSLRFQELKTIGGSTFALLTVGAVVTFLITYLAAVHIFQLHDNIALIIAAILVVTGPTVIIPLLQHIKPSREVAQTLKWEGIIIDPIGALLTVIIFEIIKLGDVQMASKVILFILGKTIFFSVVLGFILARILIFLLKKYWIPDYLEEPFVLATVVGSFALSNHIQPESGLFTVTFMGMILSNQKSVDIKKIIEFKETLVVLFISILFVVLAARMTMDDLHYIDWKFLIFLLVLILVARPVSVFLSTLFSRFTFKEKLFLSWMAPRGIVAAAVASVFSFRLQHLGIQEAQVIVPVIFGVIISTVTIYGFTSPLLARVLKLSVSNPQGVFIMGIHEFSLKLGKLLKDLQIDVQFVDTNPTRVYRARMEGLPAVVGNILQEKTLEKLDFSSIGKFMAMTSNDEANSLAVIQLLDILEKKNLYQLVPSRKVINPAADKDFSAHIRGRYLFSDQCTYEYLQQCLQEGWTLKISHLTEEFTRNEFQQKYPDAIIMGKVTVDKLLYLASTDEPLSLQIGDRVFFFTRAV